GRLAAGEPRSTRGGCGDQCGALLHEPARGARGGHQHGHLGSARLVAHRRPVSRGVPQPVRSAAMSTQQAAAPAGPAVLESADPLTAPAVLPGTLTATLHAAPEEEGLAAELLDVLGRVAGRVLYGGWPTGVAVSHAQHHGGPYPSTTSVHTSVGTTAIRRWMRPVAYQTTPDTLLPPPLQE